MHFAYVTNGRRFDECGIEVIRELGISGENGRYLQGGRVLCRVYDKKTHQELNVFQVMVGQTRDGRWHASF